MANKKHKRIRKENMLGIFIRGIALIILGILCSNCASIPLTSGTANETNYERFSEGVSTKHDIQAILGKPDLTIEGVMGPGVKVWAYHSGNNQLQFAFNQRGILTYKALISYTNGHVSMKQSNKCIAGSESGSEICGKFATISDRQRGGMVCEQHASSPGKSSKGSNEAVNDQMSEQVSSSVKSKPSPASNFDYGTPISIDYQKAIIKYFKDNEISNDSKITFQPPCAGWIKEQPWDADGRETAGYIVFARVGGKDYLCMFRNNHLVRVLTPEDRPRIKLKQD